MNASIIAVGSELLGTVRLDTNSLELTRVLDHHGIPVVRKAVAGDDARAIADELTHALGFSRIVIITGGLGPTDDDVTREGISRALGIALVRDERVLERIRGLFASRNLRMPEVNERQAFVFEGHEVLDNDQGSAPGHHLAFGTGDGVRDVWVFPGVPFELTRMIERHLRPWLETRRGPGRFGRILRLTGITESGVEERLGAFYEKYGKTTILASRGEIELHLHATGEEPQALARLDEMEVDARSLFGVKIFGVDEETLEGVVGARLLARGETVATAESCTGGLLGSRITDVPGSSSWFLGGVVAYTGDAKMFLVGVDPQVIEEHGQVSEPVAIQLAQGARRRFGATWGIGITGIAGPTGGTADKPVGTVHAAVANATEARHVKFVFRGARAHVKKQATQMALDLLRRWM